MTNPTPAPFDPANPPAFDLTSQAWAVWTFIDRTGAKNLTLAQVQERLRFHQRQVDGVTYHRPLAAAAEYVTRPDQMVKRNRNELTDEYIDPFKVAAEWKALQDQLDVRIPAPADDGDGVSSGEFDPTLKYSGWD